MKLVEALKLAGKKGFIRDPSFGGWADVSKGLMFNTDQVLSENWEVKKMPREWTASLDDTEGGEPCLYLDAIVLCAFIAAATVMMNSFVRCEVARMENARIK